MISSCLLVFVLLNVVIVQTRQYFYYSYFAIFSFVFFVEDATGNVLPKSYSPLAREPLQSISKSITPSMYIIIDIFLINHNLLVDCGCIRVLSFDDISSAYNTRFNPIPNGYGGLNWENANYMNTTWELVTYGWNGYATARTSGIFVAFNTGGRSMSMSLPVGQYFQLNSLVLSAAWNNNLQMTIKGTRNNVVIYQTITNLQVASRTTLYTLKWANVDKITFESTGGTPYPGLSGTGTHFVLDNIDITI